MEEAFGAPVENPSDPRGMRDSDIEPTDISIHGKQDVPISVYENVRNTPYLIDFYGVNDIAEKMNLVEKAKFISDFIISEMKDMKYTDTKESFAEILQSISASLPDNLVPQEKVRRIEQLIKIIQKERELKGKREWLLTVQR